MPTELQTQVNKYAKEGFSVLPIERGKKKPPEGLLWKPYQTTRPTTAELREWFANGTGNGVGIICGAVSGNLVVIDFEEEQAELFAAFCAFWKEAYGDTLESMTRVVRTGGGGWHVYLRMQTVPSPYHPAKEEKKLLPDIQGEGSYVVAPPTIHPDTGNQYEFTNDVNTIFEVSGLKELMIDIPEKSPETRTEHDPNWVIDYLAGVHDTGRNQACVELAGHYKGKGLPKEETLALLMAWFDLCTGDKSFQKKDVATCVNSSYSYIVPDIVSDYSLKYNAGVFQFEFASEGVWVRVDRLYEKHEGTSAELTITCNIPTVDPELHTARLNLLTTGVRKTLCTYLTGKVNINWDRILEIVCRETVKKYREGTPLIMVGRQPLQERMKYWMYPLLLERDANSIFGPGGSGKSFLACYLAVVTQTGLSTCGFTPSHSGTVLYLDYETNETIINERIAAICAGLGIPPIEIAYRRCVQPLATDIGTIQRLVLEIDADFIVVDSVGYACGMEPESAEVVLQYHNALRSLDVTTLSIDHVSHGNSGRPFGSVYKTNAGRNNWEVKNAQERGASEMDVGLFHHKMNDGTKHKELGLKFRFESDEHQRLTMAAVSRVDIGDIAELDDERSAPDRIASLLRRGAMTVGEIASELGLREADLTTTLNRNKSRFAKQPSGAWGCLYEGGNEI